MIPTFDWNNFTQFRDHENDSTNVSFFTLISMLGAIFFYHVTTNDHFQQCIFKNATKFYPDSDVFDRKSWQYFESSVTFFFIYYFFFIFFFTDCADSPSFSLNSHPKLRQDKAKYPTHPDKNGIGNLCFLLDIDSSRAQNELFK